MGLVKCPRCELNYMQDTEQVCDVCRKQMKGVRDEPEDTGNLCAECGENLALKGREYCAYCLGEIKRRQKLDALMEQTADMETEIDELDEIDVPSDSDIPSEDLQEINREFGDIDDEDDEEAELDEDAPVDEEDSFYGDALDDDMEEEFEE